MTPTHGRHFRFPDLLLTFPEYREGSIDFVNVVVEGLKHQLKKQWLIKSKSCVCTNWDFMHKLPDSDSATAAFYHWIHKDRVSNIVFSQAWTPKLATYPLQTVPYPGAAEKTWANQIPLTTLLCGNWRDFFWYVGLAFQQTINQKNVFGPVSPENGLLSRGFTHMLSGLSETDSLGFFPAFWEHWLCGSLPMNAWCVKNLFDCWGAHTVYTDILLGLAFIIMTLVLTEHVVNGPATLWWNASRCMIYVSTVYLAGFPWALYC